MATLLLVDAHAPTRELLTERLSADGHEVLACAEAAEGFEALAGSSFEAVILALDLPPHEGEHLAKKLRRSETGARVLIYDCAHRGTPQGVKAILDLGAHGYLSDPTDHKELQRRLEPLLPQAGKRPAEATAAAQNPKNPGEPAPQVVDSGELQLGRLPRLLLAAGAAGRDGAIVITDGQSERTLYLLGGAPVGYRSSIRREALGPWLVDQGRITESAYQASLEIMAREQRSQSAALVETGALEAGEPVYALLTEHAAHHIMRAFALRGARYRVMESRVLPSEVPALELSILPLIREGARQSYPVRFFHERIADHLDHFPYRTETFGAQLRAMALGAKELTFAMKITGEIAARELVEQARSEMREALLLLWFFERVACVRYAEARHESEDTGTYRTLLPAGRKMKPLPETERIDLCEEALAIVTASYFGALGLDITADADSVELAYHERATRFHPESYPEHDVSDLEDLFQTVQDKVGAAYRVLSLPEKRKAYLGYLLSRQEVSHRQGPITIDAEIALRRGINAMQALDFRSAELAFQEAVGLNPREPEYHCYLAFASFKAASGPAETRAREPRKVLQRALALDPHAEHALVLLAIVEHEAGDLRAARRHVLDALKANPNSATAKAALHRLDRVSESSGE